jgi:2-polyprenyl-3-methyl-5-hydroxy-6-metoxy-1,4-benzoquinol methylase
VLGDFISSSFYTAPVDRKKLRFILSSVTQYAKRNEVDVKSLDLLELGCGRGGIALSLASLGCRVLGVDRHPDSIEELKAVIERRKLQNLSATVDEACTYADDHAYDVVIMSEVLEYIKVPSQMLDAARRSMKPRAHLILTIPNGFGPWELSNVARRWAWLRPFIAGRPYVRETWADSYRHFTRKQLLELCSNAHFKLIRSANSDFILPVLGALRRNRTLGEMDTALADLLPSGLVSGWYFEFELEYERAPAPPGSDRPARADRAPPRRYSRPRR